MCTGAYLASPLRSCVRSPGSCQGGAALDDVCPPEAAAVAAAEPDRFELVAGEAGVAAGEEVTISYGSWPSDVFLLFFGFAPDYNPNDSGEAVGEGRWGQAVRGEGLLLHSAHSAAANRNPCFFSLVCVAAVLFYDLFDLSSFKLRCDDSNGSSGSGSGGSRAGSGSGGEQPSSAAAAAAAAQASDQEATDAEWERAAALVGWLEEELGPQQAFFR